MREPSDEEIMSAAKRVTTSGDLEALLQEIVSREDPAQLREIARRMLRRLEYDRDRVEKAMEDYRMMKAKEMHIGTK